MTSCPLYSNTNCHRMYLSKSDEGHRQKFSYDEQVAMENLGESFTPIEHTLPTSNSRLNSQAQDLAKKLIQFCRFNYDVKEGTDWYDNIDKDLKMTFFNPSCSGEKSITYGTAQSADDYVVRMKFFASRTTIDSPSKKEEHALKQKQFYKEKIVSVKKPSSLSGFMRKLIYSIALNYFSAIHGKLEAKRYIYVSALNILAGAHKVQPSYPEILKQAIPTKQYAYLEQENQKTLDETISGLHLRAQKEKHSFPQALPASV
jgi:hypothetical protein